MGNNDLTVQQLDSLQRAQYIADQKEYKNGKKDTVEVVKGTKTLMYSKQEGNVYTELFHDLGQGDTLADSKYEEYYNPMTGVTTMFLGNYNDGKLFPFVQKVYQPNADGSRDGTFAQYDGNTMRKAAFSQFKVDNNGKFISDLDNYYKTKIDSLTKENEKFKTKKGAIETFLNFISGK